MLYRELDTVTQLAPEEMEKVVGGDLTEYGLLVGILTAGAIVFASSRVATTPAATVALQPVSCDPNSLVC